jgi:predicted nuclease of predicted toxin-antitoxin system
MNFLFDENMPIRLVKGLQILDEDNEFGKDPKNNFIHSTELKGEGAEDPDIVREAKKLKAIIVSEDDDYKNISVTYELVIKLRVGFVFFKPPKKTGCTYDDRIAAFILAWPELKKAIANEKPPFMFIIERTGKVNKFEKFKVPPEHR